MLVQFIVLDQHARDFLRQRVPLGPKSSRNQRTCLHLIARVCPFEYLVGRRLQIAQRHGQLLLIGVLLGVRGECRLLANRIFQLHAQSMELRFESDQAILILNHVVEREAERIQRILDADELQGIEAIALDGVRLQFPQARDLPPREQGIENQRRQCHGESDHQPRRWARSQYPDSIGAKSAALSRLR